MLDERGFEQGGAPQCASKAPVGLCLARGRIPWLIKKKSTLCLAWIFFYYRVRCRAVGTNLPFACRGEPVVFTRWVALAGWLPTGKAFPLGGKVARNAPDEGKMSGSCPLISHLR